MKKILVAFISCFTLISCSISEQIIFNEDGSGKLAYTINMSKMLEITKDMDKSSKMTKDLTEGTEKDMDSVLVFKDIAEQYKKDGKELTPEQLANIEQMKSYSMRMIVNKAKSEMKYILYTDFKTVSDVGNIGSAFSTMKGLSGKKTNGLDLASAEGNSEVKFLFDGKGFSRTVIEKPYVEEVVEEINYDTEEIDTTSANSDYGIESDTMSYDDSEVVEEIAYDDTEEDVEMTKAEIKKMNKEFEKMGEMMKKGMEESTFDFQYSFSKKIKKVSIPKSNYKLSDDKKTIFIKYKFEDFTKKVKDLNLNIEFEK